MDRNTETLVVIEKEVWEVMIKPLRATMIIYGVAGIIFGLAYIFAPHQLSDFLGHEAGSSVNALLVYLGASFLPACIFLIIAARDPL